MKSTSRPAADGLWLFFGLTFAFTWLLWILVAASGMTSKTFPGALLYILGGFGPSLAAVVLVFRFLTAAERRDFWRRIVNFREISPAWYALIFLGLPLTLVLSILVSGLLGSEPPGYDALKAIAAQPVELLPLLIVGILGGPLAEELGWRGFALDRMVRRWGWLPATLILAVIWWVWHLPLFFIPGTTQHAWGVFTPEFFIFALNIVPLSVLLAMAYLRNHRSILAAVLVHFLFNFLLSLVYPVGTSVLLYWCLFLWIFAAGLLVLAKK